MPNSLAFKGQSRTWTGMDLVPVLGVPNFQVDVNQLGMREASYSKGKEEVISRVGKTPKRTQEWGMDRYETITDPKGRNVFSDQLKKR